MPRPDQEHAEQHQHTDMEKGSLGSTSPLRPRLEKKLAGEACWAPSVEFLPLSKCFCNLRACKCVQMADHLALHNGPRGCWHCAGACHTCLAHPGRNPTSVHRIMFARVRSTPEHVVCLDQGYVLHAGFSGVLSGFEYACTSKRPSAPTFTQDQKRFRKRFRLIHSE